jgi:hypothetical protein
MQSPSRQIENFKLWHRVVLMMTRIAEEGITRLEYEDCTVKQFPARISSSMRKKKGR